VCVCVVHGIVLLVLQILSVNEQEQTFRVKYYTCNVKTTNSDCVNGKWWAMKGKDAKSEDLPGYSVISYFELLNTRGTLPQYVRDAIADGDLQFGGKQ
jgi:hypothetical protein